MIWNDKRSEREITGRVSKQAGQRRSHCSNRNTSSGEKRKEGQDWGHARRCSATCPACRLRNSSWSPLASRGFSQRLPPLQQFQPLLLCPTLWFGLELYNPLFIQFFSLSHTHKHRVEIAERWASSRWWWWWSEFCL